MAVSRSLHELVEFQLKSSQDRVPSKPAHPWITISRAVGASGTELAYLLGKRLGWPVFDRHFYDGLGRGEVTDPFMEDFITTIDKSLADSTQFLYLARTIRHVRMQVAASPAVIVGRGANWFCDPQGGLRIRVVASTNNRINRLVRSEGLTQRQASECVEKSDQQRGLFIRRAFGRNIDDLTGYDLIINTDNIDVDGALEIVLHALESRFHLALVKVQA